MYLVVYDIEDDHTRTRFAKFLTRFGERIQFSVFKIKNSSRVLENIRIEIMNSFEKEFGQADSVLIFQVPDNSCVAKFGYPINEDSDLVIR